ncbi:HD-GYP domain-containing protein [Chitinilyticum aquatile]|uniref:HD-GYP domain-containing protein n=1 Tax=Chitinilyticum aquatile TaxID=362520 RepID=UPI0004007AC3|nr:two-component system response regulator [Chitinilyticum aquatile]
MNRTEYPDKPLLLLVDDSPDGLAHLHALLKDRYRIKVASTGERALQIAVAEPPPALILLDVVMPGMDGYAVCRALKAKRETRDIPVLFLTGQHDEEAETTGFAAGAVDYLHKPFSAPVLLARIATQLALKQAVDALREQNAGLEQEVARRTEDVLKIQEGIIVTMASLAEARDLETGNHIVRTQEYVKALAEALRSHPRFADGLDEMAIMRLYKSVPLHDIGKIGIPDRILLKPGKLSAAEFEVMKTHTTIGYEALLRAEQQIGLQIPFFTVAKEVALYHQEKWDGSGYPEGLTGEAIPLSARLMALADVYDALISRRVYKPPMPHEQAVAIISAGRGSHFDPDIVDAFLGIQEQFKKIARCHEDSEADIAQKAESWGLGVKHDT